MSRTFFYLRRKRGYGSRHPVPCQIGVTLESCVLPCGFGFCFAPSQQLHLHWWRQRRSVSETGKHSWLYGVNHGSICDSRPSAFSVYPRGHRVNTEAKCHRHLCAYRRLGCSPSNPSVSRTDWPPPEKITGDGRALHPRHSSGLRFQFLSVEVFPFLP